MRLCGPETEPPKVVAPIEQQDGPEQVQVEPKKRGRPAGVKKEKVEKVAVEGQPAKRRGRPRKVAEVVEVVEGTLGAVAQTASLEAEQEADAKEVAEPVKEEVPAPVGHNREQVGALFTQLVNESYEEGLKLLEDFGADRFSAITDEQLEAFHDSIRNVLKG